MYHILTRLLLKCLCTVGLNSCPATVGYSNPLPSGTLIYIHSHTTQGRAILRPSYTVRLTVPNHQTQHLEARCTGHSDQTASCKIQTPLSSASWGKRSSLHHEMLEEMTC